MSDIGAVHYIQENTFTIDIIEDWNLIGLPVDSDISLYQNIFENTIDNSLFLFNDNETYESVEYLEPGNGYWLRFFTAYQATISGNLISNLTIQLHQGWNLISGISFSISIDDIDDPDNLIISGTLYRFNESYILSDNITPGNGYWVRSESDGNIILNIID